MKRIFKKSVLACVAIGTLVFAMPVFDALAKGSSTTKREEHIKSKDIVYAEIICDSAKDLYKIYHYRFAGHKFGTDEKGRIEALERETKTHPKLKKLANKNTGIFVNGKLVENPNSEYECNLSNSIKIKTLVDFGKPFVSNVEGDSPESGQKYIQIDSPIEVKITEDKKLLADIPDIFQIHVLQFSKDTLKVCYPYEDNTSCRYRSVVELRSKPLLSTGYWSSIIY